MNKIKKVLIFIVILLFFFVFNCNSVFASTENYTFTDFSGKSHTLSAIPEAFYDYKYFIVVYYNGAYDFWVFNESITITKSDTHLSVSFDGNSTGNEFLYTTTKKWFSYNNAPCSLELSKSPSIIYSSDNLKSYSNEMNSFEFSWEEPEISTNYNFTGFDGIYYTLPPLPENLSDYKHYLIVKNSSGFAIVGFNETLQINRNESYLSFNGDNDTTCKLYTCSFDETMWKEFGNQGSYTFSINGSSIIFSCLDCIQYKEYYDDENFQFPPQTVGILAPIVQKARLVGVIQEILKILPVILMILVGLIGLRKVLNLLSKVLHRS